MVLKIAVIGAGSVVWGSTLIHDLIHTPGMNGCTVVLMDTDEGRLRTTYRLAARYASEARSDIKFLWTTNRREAIEDSDFVVDAAMAGGHHYYEKMRAVCEKHGYFRGINSVEWNMVSDYHTIWGYYQFKLAREIGEDVEDHSPDAWLIVVANPVLELTTMLGRLFKIKVVGLCHEHLAVNQIVEAMGYSGRDVEAESIGLNHTVWLTKLKGKGGEDLYPFLREWIETEYPLFYKKWLVAARSRLGGEQLSPAMVDMFKVYGLVPVGDTVRSGTWKYHRNLRAKKKWYGPLGGRDSPKAWKLYLELKEKRMNVIRDALERPEPLSSLFPSGPSSESLAPIMDALANGAPGKFVVNALNDGALEGVPNDVAVETPAIVDGGRIRRGVGMRLPTRVMVFSIYPRMKRMEWALDAFLEGGRETLLEWLMADPRTRTNEQAERTIDALLALPENEEMAKHFR